MFKKLLKLLAALVIGFVILATLQPSNYRYERSLMIHASPATNLPTCERFARLQRVVAMGKNDPNATATYTGPRAGVGATMAWNGNVDMGKGSMSISASVPQTSVKYALLFESPMKGVVESEITLTPEDEGTKVTWSMFGKNNFVGKALGLLMNCEKMIGNTYEKGLRNLKEKVKG